MGTTVVLIDHTVSSVVDQSVKMDLGYCLGQLSVIVGALLFSQGSQSTATLIPCSLHMHQNFPMVVDQCCSKSSKYGVGLIHETSFMASVGASAIHSRITVFVIESCKRFASARHLH